MNTLDLDGERDFHTDMVVGDTLVLDVRNPGSGGYDFAGCRFDPDVLKLEGHWLEGPEEAMAGNFGRAFFKFSALAPGTSELVIKIQRPWENSTMVEEYKRLTVVVTAAPVEEKEEEVKLEPPSFPPEVLNQKSAYAGESDLSEQDSASTVSETVSETVSDSVAETGEAEPKAGSASVGYSEFDDVVPVPVDETGTGADEEAVEEPGKAGKQADHAEQAAEPEASVQEDEGDSGGWFDWVPFIGDDEPEEAASGTPPDDTVSSETVSSETVSAKTGPAETAPSETVPSETAPAETAPSVRVESEAAEPGASDAAVQPSGDGAEKADHAQQAEQVEQADKQPDGDSAEDKSSEEDSGGWFDWLPWN